MHLFDIFVTGEQVFRESDTLSAGNSFDTFETEWCPMAVNICFDIRFPESSRIPALAGAKVIFNPASFNMTTGPAHWETAFRQRAIENQVYMVGTAAAQDKNAGYLAYGHSIITDPWGRVIMQMDEKEGHAVTEIDLDYVIKQKYIEREVLDKIRDQLKSNLRGVEITLEVLVENDPLRPKMEGAKTTLEDCLELIDNAECEVEK